MLGIGIVMTFRGAEREQKDRQVGFQDASDVPFLDFALGLVMWVSRVKTHWAVHLAFVCFPLPLLFSNKKFLKQLSIHFRNILSFLSVLIIVNAVKHNKEYSLFLLYLILVLIPKVSRKF